MTPAEIEQRAKAVIRKIIQNNNTPEELEHHHNLVNDLGADSLDAIEIAMAIEEEFDTDLPDELIDQWQTVGHVTDYLIAHCAGGRT